MFLLDEGEGVNNFAIVLFWVEEGIEKIACVYLENIPFAWTFDGNGCVCR